MSASLSRPENLPGSAPLSLARRWWLRSGAFEASLQPLLRVNAAGRVERANAAAAAHFNEPSPERLRGRDIADLFDGTVRLSDHAPLWPRRGAPDSVDDEARDARDRRLSVRSVPAFNVFGRRAGWTVCLQDRSAEHMARQHLDAALRLLNHDLRAPQSSILSVLELWRLRQGALDEAQLLAQVEASAVGALSLADDFVRFVRSQQAVLRREPLDLADLAAEAVDDQWSRARERRIHIRQEPGSAQAPMVVDGDAELLQRAMGSMLRHALLRSPGGATIQCAVLPRGGGVAFEVTDRGANPEPASDEAAEGVPVLPDDGDYAMALATVVAHRHGGVLRQRRANTQGLVLSLCLPPSLAPSQASG